MAKANIHYVILSGLKPAPTDPVNRLYYTEHITEKFFLPFTIITSIAMDFNPCYKFKKPIQLQPELTTIITSIYI